MDTYAPQGPRLGGIESRPRPGRVKKTFWFLLVAVLLALLVGGLYAFNEYRKTAMADFFASNTPPPVEVAAVTAQSESMPRYLTGVGTLEAVQHVTIAPQVDGRITKIGFDSGEEVTRGDFLVQLDDGPERGDLQVFQAQLQLAEVSLKRAEALAKKDFGTQANVDQYISARDQAKAAIARTEALIGQMRITAPFSGKLGVRQVNLGQYLQAGSAIATLTNLDMLYANFTLPEQARSKVAVGQSVELRVDAFPERIFEARITTIEPQVDPNTRNLRIQATLDNPDHMLLPGMYAKVSVVLAPEPDVVTLPETAVFQSTYGDTVYIIEEQRQASAEGDAAAKDADAKPAYTVKETFVTAGTRYNGKIGIVKGVEAGDKVVKDGQIRLHNGAAVIVKSEPDALQIPDKVPLD